MGYAGTRWKCAWVAVAPALAGEIDGLEEVGDGLWDSCFGAVLLARLDERMLRTEDRRSRRIRRRHVTHVPDRSAYALSSRMWT